MRTHIKKWGNSASVRIPAEIMHAAHLVEGQAVEIREEDGKVIIEPVRRQRMALEELVEGITPENLYEEISL